MLDMNTKEFKLKINDFANYYQIKDLESEAELWYNIWKEKKLAKSKLSDMEMSEVVEETDIFFPKIKNALHISLAQPCTTSTIERSFSTLRRVKTWLRSTMTENRLNGKSKYFFISMLINNYINHIQCKLFQVYAY